MSAERPNSVPAVEGSPDGPSAPRRNLAPLYAGGLLVLVLLVLAMNFGGPHKPKPQPTPQAATGSAGDLAGLLEEEALRKQRAQETRRPVTPSPQPIQSLPLPPSTRPGELSAIPGGPPESPALPPPAGVYDPRWPAYLAQRHTPSPSSLPSGRPGIEALDRVPAGASENRPSLRFRAGSPAPARSLPADSAGAALASLAAELPLLGISEKPADPASGGRGEGGASPSSRYATFLDAVGKDVPETLDLKTLGQPRRLSPFLLLQGTQIPGVLETGINSEIPGQATGYVRKDVYDTLSGRYLLIPQGSRLLGSYNSDVSLGASRLLLVWNRLVLPDGTSYPVVAPSADPAGMAGLPARVNNHWIKTLGSALMLSAISAGVQIAQNPTATTALGRTPSASETAGAAVGQELGQAGAGLIRKSLDIPPTLSLPPGLAFSVVLTRDVAFPRPFVRRPR